jgi:glycosyltransferase involved in cell wall biosynthesis
MTPLVSVMIPSYNAAKTLPLALASLLLQTYDNWECLLVDDGSADNTETVIRQLDDPRIRYTRFAKNRGRGVARQTALDQARGDYLCMLDADDWLYPWKFERQVALLQQEPDIGILSTGMALVDVDNQLVGIRGYGETAYQETLQWPRLSSLGPIPLAYAPSMIVMDLAQSVSFDPVLRRSQDSDFLFQLMLKSASGQLCEPLYVYTGQLRPRLTTVQSAYSYKVKMLWKYRRDYPAQTLTGIAVAGVKKLVYSVGARIGLWDLLMARRMRKPQAVEFEQYAVAHKLVEAKRQNVFEELVARQNNGHVMSMPD